MPWPQIDNDPVFDLIGAEEHRQNTWIQLIASENLASPAVNAGRPDRCRSPGRAAAAGSASCSTPS